MEIVPVGIAVWQQAIYNMGYQPEKKGGHTMQQLRSKIMELVNNINDLEKLKVIYQFIRGLLSG